VESAFRYRNCAGGNSQTNQRDPARLGIPEDALDPYGRHKAKISLDFIDSLKERKNGKLILVSAISPTPAGEGKTTTTWASAMRSIASARRR